MRRLLYILIASLFTFAGAKAQGIDVGSVLADSVGAEMELAEPYDEDAPEMRTLDGKVDFARMRATMAKKFLDEEARGEF